jgi:hypothetical protein|tara:strand:- start:476 stop:601 length:126 start_codon:yes stop_codon:yes gene_type:complete
MVGFAIAVKILGWTSDGPGPINVLGVGENVVIIAVILFLGL